MNEEQLREALAEYAHEAWSGWMKYLFSKSGLDSDYGTRTIPAWAVERWTRQMSTPYADLPEEEKASDREEADRMLAIVGQYRPGQPALDMTRLQEIEARYQALDPGPWQWRQGYGIGNRVHWALESPKSNAEGKVVSHLTVLYHWYPKSLGGYVEDDPYLSFMACSRDDIEWLCNQMRQVASAPELPQLNWEAAPNWATHHVYNCMGSGLWISGEATVDETWSSGWGRVTTQTPWNVDYSGYRLPIRIDWRITLQARPVASDQEVPL